MGEAAKPRGADIFNIAEMSESMNLPFPALTRRASGTVGGVSTDVMSILFSDRILVTVVQNGRLAQWLHVPLENLEPGIEGYSSISKADTDSLLPMAELTAAPLLGGHASERETLGHLYACQIASAIVAKNPNEKRLVVVGLGLDSAEEDRNVFFSIIDLVLQCI